MKGIMAGRLNQLVDFRFEKGKAQAIEYIDMQMVADCWKVARED